jgi:general secretion pathway protein L
LDALCVSPILFGAWKLFLTKSLWKHWLISASLLHRVIFNNGQSFMSILVIQLPKRARSSTRGGEAPAHDVAGAEYQYATTPDGMVVQTQGLSAAAMLPKAVTVVAVLHDDDVSWHRITLPKANAARMPAALTGVLEEALLGESGEMHLALSPRAVGGESAWVAAADKAWLQAQLAALEKIQVFVDRVVPMSWPDDPPTAHFAEMHEDDPSRGVALHWSHPDGVVTLRLQGGLARALLPNPTTQVMRWSTSPGAAGAAEQWLGAPVSVMPVGERLLQASRSLWDLRQFDLARRTRGARAVRDSIRQFMSPRWRPMRWGLIGFLGLNIAALNVSAWQQREVIKSKKAAVLSVARAAFPQVNAIDLERDPAAVVAREAQALRASAGKPGDQDLETLLQAAAAAWPQGQSPMNDLKFESGRLSLVAPSWNNGPAGQQFRDVLRPAGLQVQTNGARLTVSRVNSPASPSAGTSPP